MSLCLSVYMLSVFISVCVCLSFCLSRDQVPELHREWILQRSRVRHCLFVFLFVYVSVCIYVCLFLYLSLCVCLSFCLSRDQVPEVHRERILKRSRVRLCLSFCLFVYILSVFISVCVCLYICMCLSLYLSLSVFISVCVCLFFCLSRDQVPEVYRERILQGSQVRHCLSVCLFVHILSVFISICL